MEAMKKRRIAKSTKSLREFSHCRQWMSKSVLDLKIKMLPLRKVLENPYKVVKQQNRMH